MNDLGVVVDGTYYLLGDGWNGTGAVLIGISTADGSETCRAYLPSLAEVGLVGGGQSLLHDPVNQRLLLAGQSLLEPVVLSFVFHYNVFM